MNTPATPRKQGLYDPWYEHDACGVGFVANIKGKKSHAIIGQALTVLMNLRHRGACGCEANTGDGAGILMQVPHNFLAKSCAELGIHLPGPGEYGVGSVYLPSDPTQRYKCEKLFEEIVHSENQRLLGWRTVPTSNSTLGETARASEPVVRQVFIARDPKLHDEMAFERKLYVIRKLAERGIRYAGIKGGHSFYISSLSYKTLVYKGMLMPEQVQPFYPELADPLMESAIALVHSRFSTNTFPSWERAHPYRYIAHNGEINTLRGNINWMHARESMFESGLFGSDVKKLLPVVNEDGSDSAHVRQLPGTARALGPFAAARGDDDDSRAVAAARKHERRETRVLRVPQLPDGTVGRPGVHRVHRRHPHRRGARPQRPASVALLRDQGRPGDHGFRSRRARRTARARPAKRASPARPHVPDRYRAGPHRGR